MNIIIQAKKDEKIMANALKTVLAIHLEEFPPFASITIVVTEPYQVTRNPNWEEVEGDPGLYRRKKETPDAT